MSNKIKFNIEYEIKSSPRILYSFISEMNGLSQWFADDVTINSNVYSFNWDDEVMQANLVTAIENKKVKFHNIEDPDEYYFEMEIMQDAITNDVALSVTDFALPENVEERKMIWNAQIQLLHNVIGG